MTRPSAAVLKDLAARAREAQRHAVAPYSRFRVGAALLARDGSIVTGCNIENASFGLTLCAERVAVFKAVSEDIRRFEAIALVADSRRPVAPCGSCRQVLWELCGDIWVYMEGPKGRAAIRRLSTLLPLPFEKEDL